MSRMLRDSRFRALAGTMSVAGLLAALVAGGSASASPQAHSSACKVSNDTEAIIDDSGSMSGSDPTKLRTKFLDVYASIGANNGKTLGGVEFGSTADQLFAPAKIPGVIPAMDASFALVDADNGGTDYDAGFSLSNSSNPGATSRIFLTDGQAFPPTQHLNPKVKTYVIGLGLSSPDAQQLLSDIASQTGGPPPFLLDDPSQLQPVAGAITALQACKRVLTFTRTFTNQGQTFGLSFKAKGKSADILETWPNVGSILDIVKVFQPRGGKASASAVAHTAVKVQKKKGSTFTTVRLKGLKKGQKVKFKVKATALAGTTVGTTQVIR
jgi:hypothetical protein